jgi:antitoxin SocA-like protein
MVSMRPDDVKFRELILYIATRCAEDPYFGKTKLNKILFYTDFAAYAELGKPLTGQEYMRLPHGPAPRRMKPMLDSMSSAGEIEILGEDKAGLRQERVVAKRLPDVQRFSEPQLTLVNRMIQALWGRTNSRVSEISHANIGWRLARDRETIPYETVFLSDRPLTEAELEYGRHLATELGL